MSKNFQVKSPKKRRIMGYIFRRCAVRLRYQEQQILALAKNEKDRREAQRLRLLAYKVRSVAATSERCADLYEGRR